MPLDRHSNSADWKCAHIVTLFRTSAFTVAEFRCPGTPEIVECEEAPFPEIVLPRVGSFLRRDVAGDVLLNRTTLAFFEARRAYSIVHFRPKPDLATIISITDTTALQDAMQVPARRDQVFARSAVRMPPDILLLHRRMLREMSAREQTALAVEELATAIILRSLSKALDREHELSRPRSQGQVSGRESFVHAEAVMQYLSSAYANHITLDDVSRAVGLSPFHLCRVFHQATGSTVHQHLLSLRLEMAAAELVESNKSITEIAHEVGFSSHSHLTALFTRTFGMPPRTLRQRQKLTP
jgi:AraC-like DNA-binding protein